MFAMIRRPQFALIPLLLLILFSSGCLFRSRKVEARTSNAPLKTATLQELVSRINGEAAKIATMNATVDIAASSGGEKKGKVTDYQEIRGYILTERPRMLRMIGLFPIVRNRAFDMVSNGTDFKLWLPTKNRFIVGRNDVINPAAKQPLENLRPQHIYDALLLHEVDPRNEIAVLEGGSEQVIDPKTRKPLEQSNYIVDVIQRDLSGNWFLSRKIIFERVNLRPHIQIVFDKNGNVATEAHYENFQNYQGVDFPDQIQIERPQEEYSITLKMVKLLLNTPLKPDQFDLQQPPGAQLVRLDSANNNTTSNPPPSPAGEKQ
jgi:outer membrane lipoprotein-sorting protein